MKETPPPTIDGRRRDELRDEALSRARSYTPEWDPGTGEVGTALVSLFADIAEDVITRLDRTPEKHRVNFFRELGFDRQPPQPARLPLVFQIAEGLTRNVPISAGTQAVAPPEGDGTEQVFEIPEGAGFEATPARLNAVYSVSPDEDAIFEHRTELASGTETQLFSGANQQEHVLYLGHTDFFTLTPETEFEMRIEGDDVDALERLRWEFYGAADVDGESVEQWHTLPRRPRDDIEEDEGSVTLRFKLATGSEFAETTLPTDEDVEAEAPEDGEEPAVTALPSRWVRCVSPASLDEDLYATAIRSVSMSLVSVEDETEGLEPDMLLANDVPLPPAGSNEPPIYPFGEMPLPLDTFYVASDEAFTKKGTTVRLFFDGMKTTDAEPPDSGKTQQESAEQLDFSWEYWNGSGWAYLELTSGDLQSGDVTFEVPSDIEASAVSGHEHHWIRVRLLEDGYLRFKEELQRNAEGAVVEIEGEKISIWEMIHEAVPQFEKLDISYPPDESGNAQSFPPDHVVSRNNLAYGADEARNLPSTSPTGYQPFMRLPDARVEEPKQAIYLGFDGPLDNGPIQVLFSAVDKTYPVGFYPRARWEYLDPVTTTWVRLSATDGTEGFVRRGIVGLTFPTATTAFERFGRERHWIRARLVDEQQQFDTVVTEFGARDVPEGGSDDVLITVDVAAEQVVLENTTTQALGLSGYRLRLGEELSPPAAAENRLPADPTDSVVPPGGSLVVGTWTGVPDADVRLGFEEAVFDGVAPELVTLWRPEPDERLIADSRNGEESKDAIDGSEASGFDTSQAEEPASEESTTDSRKRCQTIEPAVLATDPRPTTSSPTLRGIYPNAGWADNVRTIPEEILGSSDGAPDQTLSFSNQPAIDETVWVDELSALTENEREALKTDDSVAVDERTDEDGGVTAFWVRWTPVENFVESTADDRHYVIDRTDGTLTFGDGTSGAIPPIGDDIVRASYRTGGGVDGSVQEGAVAALVTAIAYVEGVTNPDPGSGGADAELTSNAVTRASKTLRDRNRAVMAADFERLARTASRELERVRCIPGLDREGASRPGWVTVLLVPRTSVAKPVPSPEVKRRVEETVRQYAPAPLTQRQPEQFVVRGPSYIEVLVSATLVVNDGVASVAAVEERAVTETESFLHPLTGGSDEGGWAFGDLPCLSDVYALLERVEGVDHVESLEVTFRGSDRDHVITDGNSRLPAVAADTLVYSGTHDVETKGSGAETAGTVEGTS